MMLFRQYLRHMISISTCFGILIDYDGDDAEMRASPARYTRASSSDARAPLRRRWRGFAISRAGFSTRRLISHFFHYAHSIFIFDIHAAFRPPRDACFAPGLLTHIAAYFVYVSLSRFPSVAICDATHDFMPSLPRQCRRPPLASLIPIVYFVQLLRDFRYIYAIIARHRYHYNIDFAVATLFMKTPHARAPRRPRISSALHMP